MLQALIATQVETPEHTTIFQSQVRLSGFQEIVEPVLSTIPIEVPFESV